jgi:hypothetical protein
MGDLVRLSARRLEENRGADAPMNVAQRAGRVGVEGPGMSLLASDVGIDSRNRTRLAKLAENDTTEAWLSQRSRTECDEGSVRALR